MNVTLYKYFGEKNKVDKSGDLQVVLSLTGKLKADTSILNPSLLLSLPFEGMSYLTDENGNLIADVLSSSSDEDEVLNFNYFYIKEFRRYYYVSSIVVSSDTLLILSGEVDPLYSFKDEILDNDAMIERNEFTYDALQEDTLLPLNVKKEVTGFTISPGPLVNTTFNFNFDLDTSPKPCVFTISKGSDSGNGKTYSGVGLLPSINTEQAGDVGGQIIMALDKDNVTALMQALITEQSAYASFFKSLVAYPFEITEKDNTLIPVYVPKRQNDGTFLFEQLGNSQGYFAPSISDYKIVADFTLATPSSYLDLNPYSHYEIYIPFYGWYELKYNEIAGDRIIVYYSVNYENGSGEVYVYDYTKNFLLFSSAVQIGINLSITSTNSQELEAQKNAAQLNLILGLIGAGVGVLGSASKGNVIGAVASGITGVNALTSYVNQTSLMFESSQSTHNGPAGALYTYEEVRYRVTRCVKRTGLDLAKYAHQYGRPLRDVRKLSALSGFTQASKIHLEGCDATEPEKDIIESSLLAGVIL